MWSAIGIHTDFTPANCLSSTHTHWRIASNPVLQELSENPTLVLCMKSFKTTIMLWHSTHHWNSTRNYSLKQLLRLYSHICSTAVSSLNFFLWKEDKYLSSYILHRSTTQKWLCRCLSFHKVIRNAICPKTDAWKMTADFKELTSPALWFSGSSCSHCWHSSLLLTDCYCCFPGPPRKTVASSVLSRSNIDPRPINWCPFLFLG